MQQASGRQHVVGKEHPAWTQQAVLLLVSEDVDCMFLLLFLGSFGLNVSRFQLDRRSRPEKDAKNPG